MGGGPAAAWSHPQHAADRPPISHPTHLEVLLRDKQHVRARLEQVLPGRRQGSQRQEEEQQGEVEAAGHHGLRASDGLGCDLTGGSWVV